MVGGSQDLANILLVIFYGSVVLGIVVAVVYRRTKPDVYARIGRQND